MEPRWREGVALLKNATARDPAFHAAFCQLVYGNDQLYAVGFDHTPERLAAADAALRTTEQLKPDSPETHLARANHLYYAFRDYEGAQAQLEIAAHGLPNDSRIPELKGYIVRRQGKREEELRLLKQATTLDPRNTYLLAQIAASYEALRQYAQAIEAYDHALQIQPGVLQFRVFRLIDAALGNKEAALQEGRRATELLPREKDAIGGEVLMTYFAIIAAWAGEKELALQQLETGLRASAASVALSYGALKLLPFWDPLRGDPRFEKIVASLAPKQ